MAAAAPALAVLASTDLVGYGKWAELTFQQIWDQEPEYCQWTVNKFQELVKDGEELDTRCVIGDSKMKRLYQWVTDEDARRTAIDPEVECDSDMEMVETVKPENETLAQACARRQAEKEANSTKFYAVAVPEEHAGVYSSWGECKPHVVGVKGVRFKSFPTEEEAEEYVKNPPPPPVRPSETPEAIAAREAAKIAKEEAKAVKMAEAKAAREEAKAAKEEAKAAKAQQAREEKEKAKAEAKAAKAAEMAKKPLKQLKMLKKRRQAEAAKAAKAPEAAEAGAQAGAEATEAKKTDAQPPKKRRKQATPKVAPESSMQDTEKIHPAADAEQKPVKQAEAGLTEEDIATKEAKKQQAKEEKAAKAAEAKAAKAAEAEKKREADEEDIAAKEAKKQQAKEEKAAKAAEAKAAKAAEAAKKREAEEELEACNKRSRQELLRIAKEEARMEARIAKEVAQAVKMAEDMQAKEEAAAKRCKLNDTKTAPPVEEDPTSPSPLEKQSSLESPEKVLSQEAPRLPAAPATKEVVSKEPAAVPGLTEAQMQRIQENRARALARRSAGC